MTVNGHQKDQRTFSRVCGYVEQVGRLVVQTAQVVSNILLFLSRWSHELQVLQHFVLGLWSRRGHLRTCTSHFAYNLSVLTMNMAGLLCQA